MWQWGWASLRCRDTSLVSRQIPTLHRLPTFRRCRQHRSKSHFPRYPNPLPPNVCRCLSQRLRQLQTFYLGRRTIYAPRIRPSSRVCRFWTPYPRSWRRKAKQVVNLYGGVSGILVAHSVGVRKAGRSRFASNHARRRQADRSTGTTGTSDLFASSHMSFRLPCYSRP